MDSTISKLLRSHYNHEFFHSPSHCNIKSFLEGHYNNGTKKVWILEIKGLWRMQSNSFKRSIGRAPVNKLLSRGFYLIFNQSFKHISSAASFSASYHEIWGSLSYVYCQLVIKKPFTDIQKAVENTYWSIYRFEGLFDFSFQKLDLLM